MAVGPRERAYAEAALCGRAGDVAAMAPGSGRNDAALRAATRLGTMVAAGWVDARAVEDELAAAAEAKGKSKHDVRGTVRRGLGYGRSIRRRRSARLRPQPRAPWRQPIRRRWSATSIRAPTTAWRGRTQVRAPRHRVRLIKTSAEFVASLKPPDYLIKGVLQRRFIYSMTAPTGAGKTCIAMRIAAHVAFGVPLLGRPVKQGGVLFLAGENPDDVKMRWIKLAEEMAVDVNTSRICWLDARVSVVRDFETGGGLI